MANFIILCDPDRGRRTRFVEKARALVAPLKGLKTAGCLSGDFAAVWAANIQAPVSFVADEKGAALILGDAIRDRQKLTAESLREHWKPPGGCLREVFDGFHLAAVFDPQAGLILGADLLGIFPAYYWAEGEVLLAGSSPELFSLHPHFQAQFNPRGFVGIVLTNGLVKGETLWRGVRRLTAGHLLLGKSGRPPREFLQYRIPLSNKYAAASFREQLELLDQAVAEALSRQLVGDRICGQLMSGGLDSRLVGGYLKRGGVEVTALTLGEPSDLEMRCAVQTGRALGFRQHGRPIGAEVYPEYAAIQAKWEHCANGFSNIWGWGIPPLLKGFPPRIATGFLMDVILGGAYPKGPSRSPSFAEILKQTVSWGISPEALNDLLNPGLFGDLVRETVEALRTDYEEKGEDEAQRTTGFKLRHRQRFHVGGVVWQTSFGAWPLIPAVDQRVLEVVGGLPEEALSGRRMQEALVCTYFPKLAAIPLDTNSYSPRTLRPTRGRVIRDRLEKKLEPVLSRLRPAVFDKGAERRHYYRLYDFNGSGWQAVRHKGEVFRNRVEPLFNREAFSRLLPPAGVTVPFPDGIVDASGAKILLGLLLWAEQHLAEGVG